LLVTLCKMVSPLTHQPRVSVITLNWNNQEVTCDLLRSIKELNTYPNLEVLIVDNASSEDPTNAFLSVYPGAKVIRNSDNLGFSAGNNVGIRKATGEYLFLVNNDTEFTPNLIEGLVQTFSRFPDAGVVCPKFHYFFAKGTIEYAGYNPVNIFTGRNSMIGCRQKDEGQYNTVKETNYAHGGGMMVSRKVIEEVGMMPEDFFLYYEELDWSVKIKKKGFKIYYQPASLIYHKESMTTGKMSPLKTFYLTRNRILFMRRNVPIPGLSVFILYFIFFTFPKNTISYLLKRQGEHLKWFLKGILWHFNSKIKFN
jgi:GT2 family glycosyltransferase